MDSFYLTTITIAVIILILMLTYVGILLYTSKSSDVFPHMENQCPDYWQLDNFNKCIFPTAASSRNRGSIPISATPGEQWRVDTGAAAKLKNLVNIVTDAGKEKSEFDMNHGDWSNLYGAKSALCNKKKWADVYSISWDGVSNTNQC
jgi:hypothetical protein